MGRRRQRLLAAVLLAAATLAPTAVAEAKRRPVAAPKFVRNIATGETGWF
jgi:hypothetical protein